MTTPPKVWTTDKGLYIHYFKFHRWWKVALLLSDCNILKTTHFLFVLDAIRFNLNYLLFIHTCSSAWKATFIIEKLIWSTYSKRTSGFDMAPPTSAILGATGVAGTLFHVYITNIFNLNFFFFFSLFFVGVDPSMENSYQITWCLLFTW